MIPENAIGQYEPTSETIPEICMEILQMGKDEGGAALIEDAKAIYQERCSDNEGETDA